MSCKCRQLLLNLQPGQLAAAELGCELALVEEHQPHVVNGYDDGHGSAPPPATVALEALPMPPSSLSTFPAITARLWKHGV
jgi:hypothetical protein